MRAKVFIFRSKRRCVLQFAMAQLTLSFLGTFQVVLGDKPITKFRSANVQGLLVYLALHPGRALSRDVLAALFWPDEPDSTARTNFRQTLYQLRKLLAHKDAAQPFLIVTRQTVQFNPESDARCDVTAFLHLLKLGDLATAVGHPGGLYAGELLPGFTCDSLEFEDWLRRERERLHGLALDALHQRTEWLLSSGNLAEAKALAQRQLELEPWRELAHRQMMQALALAGDRQGALAQFALCQKILWSELAVEPEAGTAALAEQIAAGEELTFQTRPQHNLIAPVTAYFGREEDLAAVRERITNRDYRLVTLVGEGGIGKSRLALEVSWQLRDQFADGVWFVPLAGLAFEPPGGLVNEQVGGQNLPEVIATAVLQALDQPSVGQQSSKAQLLTFMQTRQMLLVLDNFEPLLAGAQLVLDLLHQAPGLCVICTSREPLNFQAEWVLPLARLPLPPIADPFLNTTAVAQDPTTFPAVQLFVDRAQRANGRFQLNDGNVAEVVTLCRLLAGLPLALELAAAALRHQMIAQLTATVQHSIDNLSTRRRDIPLRHRSMRAVFDSSWAMLTPDEQAQFASLSVFLGPFSTMAATAVTDATLPQLQTLQEKSLLQQEGDRFVFHSLLREFAAEKLADSSDPNSAASRHSHYYLQAVADLVGALNGEMPHLAVQRIARALENIRGAWETAVSQQEYSLILAALVPLSDFCQIRGLYREGLRLFGEAAAWLRQQAPKQNDALAKLLTQQAAMHVRLSDYPQAIAQIEEALFLTADDWVTARLHITWGEALWRQGNLAEAENKLQEALSVAQAIDSQSLIGIATFHLGVVQDLNGTEWLALESFEAALTIWRQLGNLRWQGFTLNSIGNVAQRVSKPALAETSLREALRIGQANNDRQAQSSTLNNLSLLATKQGEFAKANDYLCKALTLAKASGDLERQGRLNHNLAWNAKQAAQLAEATTFAEDALAIYMQIGNTQEEKKVRQLLEDLVG
ncbi:tetratricopeptide repeat protein [Candidatus Leptofilum sp.]|uniref:tetratricopeptide repeat protein n=1 Tax=Candidatus Leptofilum sp. TaxID=3241576 RepID=UPI003B59DEFA